MSDKPTPTWIRETRPNGARYLWALNLIRAREGRWLAAWAWRMAGRLSLLLAWGLR